MPTLNWVVEQPIVSVSQVADNNLLADVNDIVKGGEVVIVYTLCIL